MSQSQTFFSTLKQFVSLAELQNKVTQLETYQYEYLQEIRILGSGSYGDVKLFYDKNLKKQVVGKFFRCSGQKETVENRITDARREAAVLARCEHRNIIRILGAEEWYESTFGIFLEYAPCGDLESLLHLEKELSLSWKLRARFFCELANALNYLHNHDPNRSYIHGDLKPQNVLLGDRLEIKLADFGAAAIAKATSASSLTSTGYNNTQHTPYYTAPEFLRDPTQGKCKSMDIYSFGMTGYEIITRKVVFSTVNVKSDVMLHLITTQGEKPDEKVMDEIEIEEVADPEIFVNLKEIVKQCWKTEPDNRPTILEVKNRLQQLARSKPIYDEATNEEVKVLAKKRKQGLESGHLQEQNKIFTASGNLLSLHLQQPPLISPQEGVGALLVLLLIAIITLWSPFMSMKLHALHDGDQGINVRVTLKFSDCFLAINSTKLFKYDFYTQTISFVSNHYTPHKDPLSKLKPILNINGQVYVCNNRKTIGFLSCKCYSDLSSSWKKYKRSNHVGFNYAHYADPFASVKQTVVMHNQIYVFGDGISLQLNAFADQSSTWKRLDWEEKYEHRKYIGFKGNIMAVGARDHHYKFVDAFHALGSSAVDLYNTATGEWSALPSMNEPRAYHSLVLFEGKVCVIGGEKSKTSECFDSGTNKWTYLPPMLTRRREAAAVELGGELYVIGGEHGNTFEQLRSVEKYNPVTETWSEVADLKQGMTDHAVGVYNEKIYVIGGNPVHVEAYNPSKIEWQLVDTFDYVERDTVFTVC